jgi:hypothetical protein
MPNDPLSCNGTVYIKLLILNFKDFFRSQIFFMDILRKKKKIRKIENFNGL